jgi:hypothetical protein
MQEKNIASAAHRSILDHMLKNHMLNGTNECKIDNVKVIKNDSEGKITTAEGTFDVISDEKAKITSGTFSSKFDASKTWYRVPVTTLSIAKKDIAYECSAKEVKELVKSVASVKGFGGRKTRKIGDVVMKGVLKIIGETDLINESCSEMVSNDPRSYCDDYCNEHRH